MLPATVELLPLNALLEADLRRRLFTVQLFLRDHRRTPDPTEAANPGYWIALATARLDDVRLRFALGYPPESFGNELALVAHAYTRLFALRDPQLEQARAAQGLLLSDETYRPERLYTGIVTAIISNRNAELHHLAEAAAYVTRGKYAKVIGHMIQIAGAGKPPRAKMEEPAPPEVHDKLEAVDAGLIAAATGNPAGLAAALDRICTVHELLARSPDGSLATGTLLSFDALAVAAIAFRRGVPVNYANRYMPLELIA